MNTHDRFAMKIDAREVWLKDGEKLILRSPTPDEAETLLSHLKVMFRESYRNMNGPADRWDTFPVEKEREILEGFANDTWRFMISAFTKDGAIAGNLTCMGDQGAFQKHCATLGMGMLSQYQGRGLGNQLLQTAKFEAAKAGFRRLELNVRTFNKPGIALYEKIGFTRCGHLHEVALIDGEYFDEYVYELRIGSV